MEMGYVYAALGSKVVVLEALLEDLLGGSLLEEPRQRHVDVCLEVGGSPRRSTGRGLRDGFLRNSGALDFADGGAFSAGRVRAFARGGVSMIRLDAAGYAGRYRGAVCLTG